MILRKLNIGTRLGAGFAVILVAMGAMLAGTLVSSALNREALLRTLQSSTGRESLAAAAQQALLGSAVAVRNLGLQATVEDIERDEAEAKRQRATYIALLKQLQDSALEVDERAPLTRLADIDRQMETHFKDAVELAATLNGEKAAKVITTKVDPLLKRARAELDGFVALQQRHASAATEGATREVQATQTASVAAGVLVLLGSALLAWRLTLSITVPLRSAANAAARVAAGELDFTIDHHGRDEAAQLLCALGEMRRSLASVVAKVRHNAESVATASREIAQGNQELSSRTEQQASALQQTAATMQQLGSTARQSADSAGQANQLALGASNAAAKGGEVVGRVVDTMKEINASSKTIGDIISVIDGIAFQTNILALNAAVEAARAGEQGRGFAVVAAEVRSLAQRSAKAAKDIHGLITASVERVEQGTTLVDQAGATMTEIVSAIRRVADMMGEVTAASREQSTGVAQVGESVGRMDSVTQQNAALVEEGAAAAESLQSQAQQLVESVAVFRL